MRLKGLGFSMIEIKEFTVPQINLIMQRHNEPIYKRNIEAEINKKTGNDVIGRTTMKRRRA